MISPDELLSKAQRLYPKAVSAWLANDLDFFPYRVAANLSVAGKSQSEVIREVSSLRERSKEHLGFGYTVHYEQVSSRSHGANHFPKSIEIDSLDDLLKLTRKQTEFHSLASACGKLRRRLPELEGWLTGKNWKRLVDVAEHVDDLIEVVEYLREHPRPDCYLRELPLAISTKRIEQNKPLLRDWLDKTLPPEHIDFGCDNRDFERRYGFRYLRKHLFVRLLDPTLRTRLGFPCDEFSVPADEIAKLSIGLTPVIIVENKINLLSLPSNEGRSESAARPAIALGGLGNDLSEFAKIPWLEGHAIRYWGDLDVEGLQILARFRHLFPQTESFLMDLPTLEAHRVLWTAGNQKSSLVEPPELQQRELAAFRYCAEYNVRLEQEHIPQAFVVAAYAD